MSSRERNIATDHDEVIVNYLIILLKGLNDCVSIFDQLAVIGHIFKPVDHDVLNICYSAHFRFMKTNLPSSKPSSAQKKQVENTSDQSTKAQQILSNHNYRLDISHHNPQPTTNMKTTTAILALFGLLILPAVTARALPDSAGSGLPYPVKPMALSGNIGGYDVQLSGSIQEIHAQMKTIYPDFDPAALNAAKNSTTRSDDLDFTFKLTPRGGKLLPPICCPIRDWKQAGGGPIDEGIFHLNNVGGTCGVDAKSCSRISCSWGAAIFLCNDNDYGITPQCLYLSTYAHDIRMDCYRADSGDGVFSVCGQEFDSDNYNIIVRKDSC